MSCPDENTIVSFVSGELPAAERSVVSSHLEGCEDCLSLVAEAAGRSSDEGPRVAGPGGLPTGTVIGRYTLLELVGSGGMGDVYAAYDPKLRRRVALKLVNERVASPASAARFDREAQAVARLSHPNVIAIYDAGEFAGRVYLAMEFVDGETLSGWLAARPRSWRQIRDVFAAAAMGLAAAHEAGLVHRDFKPQNVMVGRDGSVRVMDFGLAADVSDMEADESQPAAAGVSGEPTSGTLALTRTGMLLGTPLYMAPEQFLRKKTDARTDQFSFSVALFEALFGERPFPSQSLPALAEAVVGGRLREPAQRGRVPAFLWRILVRGLAADPAARFSSMGDLLHELRHDPLRRRRAFAIGVAASVVLVATAAGAHRVATRGQRMCRSGGDKLAGVWELDERGERREAVHRAFASTGLGFAEETWGRVSALLDDYSRHWSDGYTDACEATHVRGDQSAEVMDLRMTCLEDARRGLKALTDVFAGADAAVVTKGVDAVWALAPLDRCTDTHGLLAVTRLPTEPAKRSQVAALQARLAVVKALGDTGRLSEARRQIGPIVDEVHEVGFKPLVAEALAARGWIEQRSGANAEAVESLQKAVWASLASGRDDLAADSVAILAGATAFYLDRADDGKRWAEMGEALLERLGPGHDRSASWLYEGEAAIATKEGRYQDALTDSARAVALKQKTLPPDHPDIAISLYTVANVQNQLGHHDAALIAATKAVEIYETAYGGANPQLAAPLNNRGETLMFLGRYPEAERDLRRAVGLSSAWVGAESPVAAYLLTALGKTLEAERRWGEASSFLQRALRIRERSEPDPALVAETRFALARARWELGEDRAGAKSLALAARDAFRKVKGHEKEASEVDSWLADKQRSAI